MTTQDAFIPFGAQYYRAPTPSASDWSRDLDNISQAGFNTVKLWAQWRWNQPEPDRYDFSDLDRLMDLADERGIRVIINTIFDCAPAWLLSDYPDCRIITSDGRALGPVVTASRQIGGSPGPCLNHPEARDIRMAFLAETVKRYADHPALWVWDLWNEPEISGGLAREPKVENQVCYCDYCVEGFIKWLEDRYGSVEALNERWGRRYRSWDDVEVPVSPSAFGDMIDWRLFNIGVITREMRRRADLTRRMDQTHAVMCHTVAMPIFNPVTCASDDWELAEICDVFGNTLSGDPMASDLVVSAAGGKLTINAEIHALPGNSLSRPKPLDLKAMKRHLLTPLGHGIKGFVFWQYRPERIGLESPAWGLSRVDGASTPWMLYARQINNAIQADAAFYAEAAPVGPEVGIIYNPANHIFSWCAQGCMSMHDAAIRGTYKALHEGNFRVRFIHPSDIRRGKLAEMRALIYPFPYLLDGENARALRDWVESGGTLISEVFFGAYSMDTNLHEVTVPGFGFDEVFGAREMTGQPYTEAVDLYACEHGLSAQEIGPILTVKEDLVDLPSGEIAHGYLIETPLEITTARTIGTFDGKPGVVTNDFGKGKAILCGTLMSVAAGLNAGAQYLLCELARLGQPEERPWADTDANIRIDVISDGKDFAFVAQNLGDYPVKARIVIPGVEANTPARNVISGEEAPVAAGGWLVNLPVESVELFKVGR